MPMNGSTVLLAVDTGSEFEIIPCQANGEYALSADTFDTSCKDTGDATNLPGRRSRTMSVEANPAEWPDLVANPTTVEQVLRKAAETGLQVDFQVFVGGTATEEGTASITSLSITFPDQDKVTMSIEMAISGGMTPVP